jgi:hypothetical protein
VTVIADDASVAGFEEKAAVVPPGRPLTSRAIPDGKFVLRIRTVEATLWPCLTVPLGADGTRLKIE